MTEEACKCQWLHYNDGKLLAFMLLIFSSNLHQLQLNVFQETLDFLKQKKEKKKPTKGEKTSPSASFHFVSAFYLPGHLFPTHTLCAKRFPVLPPFVTRLVFGVSPELTLESLLYSHLLQQLMFHKLNRKIGIEFHIYKATKSGPFQRSRAHQENLTHAILKELPYILYVDKAETTPSELKYLNCLHNIAYIFGKKKFDFARGSACHFLIWVQYFLVQNNTNTKYLLL